MMPSPVNWPAHRSQTQRPRGARHPIWAHALSRRLREICRPHREIHDLIDVGTVRAVADTAAELRDDLDKGGGVSGPAARDVIKIATRATQSGRGRRDRAPAGRLPAPEAARAADGIILGPVSHSDYPARDKGGINGSAHLRVQLDLYANIRPCRSPRRTRDYGRTPLDLVIVRENTGRLLCRPHHVHGHRRVHAHARRCHRHAQSDSERTPAHRQDSVRTGTCQATAEAAHRRADGEDQERRPSANSASVPF